MVTSGSAGPWLTVNTCELDGHVVCRSRECVHRHGLPLLQRRACNNHAFAMLNRDGNPHPIRLLGPPFANQVAA